MRRFLAVLILGALVVAVLYHWKFKADVPAAARDEAKAVGDRLGQVGEAVSEKLRGARLTGTVKAALELNREVASYPIDVDAREDGVVLLKGRVPTLAARTTAERVAAAVTAVKRVDNQLLIDPALAVPAPGAGRTLGENFDDRALEAKVRLAFSLHREMAGADVTVSSFRREVTLAGRVANDQQRQVALQIAREIPDVAAVRDQLATDAGALATPAAQAPAGAPLAGADLGSRARAVERALLANPNLSGFVFKVRPQGSGLVLEGRVRTGSEKDLAGLLAKDAAGAPVTNNVTVQP